MAGSSKLKSMRAEKNTQPSTNSTVVRHERPQVLVIDCETDVSEELLAAGYDVTRGSLGYPYEVPKGDGFVPVTFDTQLGNYPEQDIVIVDVVGKPAQLDSPAEHAVDGVDYVWAACNAGEIDPRPFTMLGVRDKFDRILDNGGVLIVFASPRQTCTYSLSQSRYGKIDARDRIEASNWDLLSVLGSVHTHDDYGKDIKLTDQNSALGVWMSRHLKDATFACGLDIDRYQPNAKYVSRQEWHVLASNRYDVPVAASIGPLSDKSGFVLILPDIRNKAEALRDLLANVLPELTPSIFPAHDQFAWVHRPEYESPKVTALHVQIGSIVADARAQIDKCSLAITEEQTQYAFMYDLLRATGDGLVNAVQVALAKIGFTGIHNRDSELGASQEKTNLAEDLWIDEPDKPLILVEIKGLQGLVPDAEALQAWKYVAPRIRRLDVRALAIINHQRGIPPLDRDNQNVFRQDVITNAEANDFGLMTTWDLFWILKNMAANCWPSAAVKEIFYRSGKISQLPDCYARPGTVERFLDRAGVMSIRLKTRSLRLGDTVALVGRVNVLQQHVDSMQVDREPRAEAQVGELVGIKTPLEKESVRVGEEVYVCAACDFARSSPQNSVTNS